MGDHLRVEKPPQYFTQANSAGWKMSTNESAVMLCGWGVKTGMAHSTCG